MPGSVIVSGLPYSRKTPGVFLNVILGGPGTGAGSAADLLMLVGNMLETTITLTTPALTFTAGTAALATPVQVFSETDAIDKFGRGSELHLMCAGAFDQDPTVPLWATPVAKASGATNCTSTLTLTGTVPTSDLTIALYCDGKKVEFVVPAATTIDDLGTMIAQAILDSPDMPVYAQENTTTDIVTFTAKEPGARGAFYSVKVDITVGTVTYKLRTGNLAATAATTVFTLSSEKLAGGSGTETTTFETAKAALATQRWNRIVLAQVDSTNLQSMATQILTKAGPTQMLWEQMIAGNVADLTTTTTGAKDIAAGLNNPRAQIVWHYNSDRSPGTIAAYAGCARLMGDSRFGGSVDGESTDPSCNLDGVILGGIPQQELVADRPLPSEIETALNYGVTPLAPSNALPGKVEIVRCITTRFKDATGSLNYAVLDTSETTVTDYVAALVRTSIANTYKSFKLADDPSDGSPPSIPKVVTPSQLKAFIATILRNEESLGHIINVDVHASKLNVVRDTGARGRANGEIPVEPAPGFHIFGGNVRQQQA